MIAPSLCLIQATLLLGGVVVFGWALRGANPRWRIFLCEWAVVGLFPLPLLPRDSGGLTLPPAEPAEAIIPLLLARQEADGSMRDAMGPVLGTVSAALALAPGP